VSGFLLDSNVISELVKPRPEPRVTRWIDATDEGLLCLSVLTLGEIRKSIASLPDASGRVPLETWLDTSSLCALRAAFWRSIKRLLIAGAGLRRRHSPLSPHSP
jgi:predicted nucleic acid-binding protein